jgi:hemoglobin
MSWFDELGGEATLRPLIDDFVDRCFDDMMIGFFFRKANRKRIKEFEYQHAAQWLGADVKYEGRSLAEAHARHPIMGGQFDRRLQILREVLDEHGVPAPIRDEWIAHQQSMRSQITPDPDSNCNDGAARDKVDDR